MPFQEKHPLARKTRNVLSFKTYGVDTKNISGFDTTSSTLQFLLYHLGKQADILFDNACRPFLAEIKY
jgi:hypothetical protein